MKGPYDDIINLPHHVSRTRARMPESDRAAQFSPFAALTGFEATVEEAGRQTQRPIELAVDAREDLDEKLARLREKIGEAPFVKVTYFVPDGRKSGGAYVTAAGHVRKLREYEGYLLLDDGTKIPLGDIAYLEEIPTMWGNATP